MDIFHIILLGIVEGITEFLPISSTAHLGITQLFLGIPNSDFIKSFEITIQLGAILAVIFLYRHKVLFSRLYVRNILIAFIPTGVIGFLLYKFIKFFLMGNTFIAAIALILGGIVILLFEHKQKKEKNEGENTSLDKTMETISIRNLLILGVAQSLAVVPGVSRSGAIIIAGRFFGFSKIFITEFSFLLAIPTMLAATSYDLLKSGFVFTSLEWGSIMLGFIVSFFVALLTIKWLVSYIKNHDFVIFGWYRIIFGLLVLFLFY